MPGQVSGVEPVSVSEGMYQLAYEEFRSRALRANTPHDCGPFGARKIVHAYPRSSGATLISFRNPRLLVRITPPKVAPIARTATKTLISSTLMLPTNPFGPFSHAP